MKIHWRIERLLTSKFKKEAGNFSLSTSYRLTDKNKIFFLTFFGYLNANERNTLVNRTRRAKLFISYRIASIKIKYSSDALQLDGHKIKIHRGESN